MSAADTIWALVSGLPHGKRERQRMLILQAFTDDSGNEPTQKLFVLAGFVSPASAWALFSDEWQAALDTPPRLEYFKMAEANRMQEQFHPRRGWDETKRDERVLLLARIARKYASFAAHVSISHADFAKR